MITLAFTGENGDKIFQFLYDGFLIGGALVKEKGISVLRNEVKILEKLETISQPCECGRKLVTGEEARELRSKEDEFLLDLEDAEFDLLKNYFEAVPWKTSVAKDIVRIADWLILCARQQRYGETQHKNTNGERVHS